MAAASPCFEQFPLAGARPGVGPSGRAAGAPAGRRHGGDAGAVDRRDGRRISGRTASAGAASSSRWRGVAGAAEGCAGAAAARAAASAADGALRSAGAAAGAWLARGVFGGSRARALFAGIAAHSVMPLDEPAERGDRDRAGRRSAHAVGWPCRARRIAADQRRAGGLSAVAGRRDSHRIAGERAAGSRLVMCDVSPRQLLATRRDAVAARLPPVAGGVSLWARRVQARLGAGRSDSVACAGMCARRRPCTWAGPWRRSPHGRRTSGAGRSCCWRSTSLFDATRAPAGKHTAWAYCHVPNGSTEDMTERDRGAGRAIRAGFSRADAGAARVGPGRPGAAEREPDRRRYRRRSDGSSASCVSSHVAGAPHAAPGGVHLLGVDASGRRGARDVRIQRGKGGPREMRFCWAVMAISIGSLRAGEDPRTLEAFPGKTPVLDGVISQGEWDDATKFTGVEGWRPQFMPRGECGRPFAARLRQARRQTPLLRVRRDGRRAVRDRHAALAARATMRRRTN